MPGAMHPGDVISVQGARVCCPGHRMFSGQKANALERASSSQLP
jgi:hypothetical protein